MRLDRLITLALFGPLARLANNAGIRIPILMYHSISHEIEEGVHPYYQITTSPEVFSQHMSMLADRGFQVIGLDAAIQLLQQDDNSLQDLPAKPVVITFDDGYLDFYTNAYPVLARYGFTATVFLPTSFIGSSNGKIGGKTFLSWKQVNELVDCGISFGSHTNSHSYLLERTTAEAEQELRQSREIIEQKIGSGVRFFSYPFAFPEHDKRFVNFLRKSLQACGYLCGVTTIIGTATQGDDPFTLKRIPLNALDDPALLDAKINGGYDWMHATQYAAKTVRNMIGLRKRKRIADWPSQ